MLRRLSDEPGKAVPVWEAETRQPTLAYPSKEPALTRGQSYVWRIAARSDRGKKVVYLSDGDFFVATQEKIDTLAQLKPLAASEDTDDLVTAARVYALTAVRIACGEMDAVRKL